MRLSVRVMDDEALFDWCLEVHLVRGASVIYLNMLAYYCIFVSSWACFGKVVQLVALLEQHYF
ncbi:hypothetical protein LguiA_004672 [Lonicera macranthoides]